MGLLSYLFGGGASRYSQEDHFLSTEEINRLFDRLHKPGVSEADEDLVQQAILDRRGHDGKISLRAIYETLTRLMQQHRITKYDREAFIKTFEGHFKKN